MEDKYKACGWAFSIYGIGLLVFSALIYSTINTGSIADFGNLNFIFGICVFVVGFLTLFCGVSIFIGSPKVHKLAVPISIIALVSLPIGTMVGGLYLWLRYKNA